MTGHSLVVASRPPELAAVVTPSEKDWERVAALDAVLGRAAGMVTGSFVNVTEAEALLTEVRGALTEDHRALLDRLSQPATLRQIQASAKRIVVGFALVAKTATEGFGYLLVEDLASASPSIGALEAAVRSSRRDANFVPSIATMLKQIAEEESVLRGARRAVERLSDYATEIETLLIRRRELDARLAERKEAERQREVQGIREALKRGLNPDGDVFWGWDLALTREIQADLAAEAKAPGGGKHVH